MFQMRSGNNVGSYSIFKSESIVKLLLLSYSSPEGRLPPSWSIITPQQISLPPSAVPYSLFNHTSLYKGFVLFYAPLFSLSQHDDNPPLFLLDFIIIHSDHLWNFLGLFYILIPFLLSGGKVASQNLSAKLMIMFTIRSSKP